MEIKEKVTKISQLIDELDEEIPEDLSTIPEGELEEIISTLQDAQEKIGDIIDSICEGEEEAEDYEGKG